MQLSQSRRETETAFVSANRRWQESMTPSYIVLESQPHLAQKILYIQNQETGEKHTV